MAGNYDNSASFYDGLSRLVFGNEPISAQIYLLKHIPANAAVLIAGGGTGRILEEITKIHPSGLRITYVELSARMLALAQKRNFGSNQVRFINAAIENVDLKSGFDVVITSFLFDNFTADTLTQVFEHMHPALKPGGLWLNTDFQLTGKWWQFVLLKTMLLFFKVLCGVEAWHFPDTDNQFKVFKYQTAERKSFFRDFIITVMYRKPV